MKNNQTNEVRAVGVDIGRVLIGGEGPDSSFLGVPLEQAMKAPPIEGATEALTRLVARFGDRVFLVSKCGPGVEKKTWAWLKHHRIYERTGLREDHVHFCRERPEKAVIAQRLRLDAFVDDRLDVLVPMKGQVRCLVHFGVAETEDGILAAPDWRRALAHLLR